MSTLYIRLPCRATAGDAPGLLAASCPYALVSRDKAIEQHGIATLPQLSGAIAQAQRVVLLLAAADVTLLRMKVPPLSAAKLKAALPNLVEEQLLGDPAGCIITAGNSAEGLRTIAVAQRDWLEMLSSTFAGYGARQIAALPAQSCLTCDAGGAFAAIGQQRDGLDVALRLSRHHGIGWSQPATPAREILTALRNAAPGKPLTLSVPHSSLNAWQDAAATIPDISVTADDWVHWLDDNGAPDLMGSLDKARASRMDWRAWRWPLALTAALLLVNLAALNLDWWSMRREATALRNAMVQTYRAAFPQESVIIDPLAQMQQKIALSRRGSGLAAPDDFTALLAAFAESWSANAGQPGAIAGFEYRDHALFVRLKPGSDAAEQAVRAALAARNLSLEASAQGGAALWKIGSAR